jgi:hypothetical protein
LIEQLGTDAQRGVSFYFTWFNRIYVCSDAGWTVARTPDDKPITEQDAYFWFALEAIARELNLMRAIELAKLTTT